MEKHLVSLTAPEIELVYKTKVRASERIQINGTRDVYNFLFKTWDKNKLELQEQFKVLLLNKGNRVLGIYELSTGGVTGAVADPKLIFVAALKANACAIIIAHNHPSGDASPSIVDEILTTKIVLAGKLLDISVLDHIIVTRNGYYSIADKSLI